LIGMNPQIHQRPWKDFFDFEQTCIYVYMVIIIGES